MADHKKRHFPFIKILILIILVGFFVILGLNVSEKDTAPEINPVAPVVTVKPRRGRIERIIHLSGYILSEEMVTVSPRISAIIESLEVGMGDYVEEGELLVRMDEAPMEITLLQARAAFLSAESTFRRLETLYEKQAATRQSYDEARAGYEAARSQYELAQLNLEYGRILAPLSGAVLETHTNRGALVGPGVPLVTIGNLEALAVEVKVPEQHYSFFLEGRDSMEAFMEVPALMDRIFPLKIAAVASHINPATRSFIVKCSIPQDEAAPMRPGMFVKVGFVTDFRKNVLYLPFRAAAEGGRLWYVDGAGKSAYVDLEPDFTNEYYFSLPDEFEEYVFILEGQHFLVPGRELNIIEERSFGGRDREGRPE